MDKTEKVAGNFIWRLLERFGAQGVTLLVSIVLARLLDPTVYGTIALVTVFTQILHVFIDSGLGTALIQKKDADDLDFSSVFYFNIAACTVIYLLLFLAAPLIARFYEMPELTPVVRVLGLTLVISGVKNIQQAYVSRHMMFKKFFFATLGGTLGAAVVGITMAWMGFGVWALIGQYLFNALVDTAVLWFTVKWRPKWMFSWKRLKKLLGFGSKLLGVSLINTTYNNIRQLIIGKMYSTEDLAFYNKGKQFPSLLDSNINTSIDSILLPAMAQEQDDIATVKRFTQRSIKTSTFIMAPLLIGLAVCGDALISLVLTEKWLPCVPFMRVFCVTYLFTPMFTANYNAYKALGRSDIFLRVSMASKPIGLVILLLTMPYGVMTIAYGMIAANFCSQLVCTFPNRKLLKYGYLEQIGDILPQLLLAAGMGVAVYCVQFLNLAPIVTLLIQIPMGITLYVLGSWLFKFDSFQYLLNMIKSLLNKKTRKTSPASAEKES